MTRLIATFVVVITIIENRKSECTNIAASAIIVVCILSGKHSLDDQRRDDDFVHDLMATWVDGQCRVWVRRWSVWGWWNKLSDLDTLIGRRVCRLRCILRCRQVTLHSHCCRIISGGTARVKDNTTTLTMHNGDPSLRTSRQSQCNWCARIQLKCFCNVHLCNSVKGYLDMQELTGDLCTLYKTFNSRVDVSPILNTARLLFNEILGYCLRMDGS